MGANGQGPQRKPESGPWVQQSSSRGLGAGLGPGAPSPALSSRALIASHRAAAPLCAGLPATQAYSSSTRTAPSLEAPGVSLCSARVESPQHTPVGLDLGTAHAAHLGTEANKSCPVRLKQIGILAALVSWTPLCPWLRASWLSPGTEPQMKQQFKAG